MIRIKSAIPAVFLLFFLFLGCTGELPQPNPPAINYTQQIPAQIIAQPISLSGDQIAQRISGNYGVECILSESPNPLGSSGAILNVSILGNKMRGQAFGKYGGNDYLLFDSIIIYNATSESEYSRAQANDSAGCSWTRAVSEIPENELGKFYAIMEVLTNRSYALAQGKSVFCGPSGINESFFVPGGKICDLPENETS